MPLFMHMLSAGLAGNGVVGPAASFVCSYCGLSPFSFSAISPRLFTPCAHAQSRVKQSVSHQNFGLIMTTKGLNTSLVSY